MFSKRTSWERRRNDLSLILEARQTAGASLLDLTVYNPTACGFTYEAAFYRGLTGSDTALYEPAPLGLTVAREAVAAYYAERGCDPGPGHVMVAASTSELYAHLLTLFCDPGDQILVPRPGYPLFDLLGDITGVERVPYALGYDGLWHVPLSSLEAALAKAPRCRAVILISPNNPTGNFLKREELSAADVLCARRGLGLIVDEVFYDYPLRESRDRVPALAGRAQCLTFGLSGLSKTAGLPQMKLAWAGIAGPDRLVSEAIARLEIVADTYLSAATPVQLALPRILREAAPMRARILARCRENLALLRDRVAGTPLSVLDAEGGWTALVRLPVAEGLTDEAWAQCFLEQAGVRVQPGYLFDFSGDRGPPLMAISLLTPTDDLLRGMDLVLRLVADLVP